jgi:copper(I)-binding protein
MTTGTKQKINRARRALRRLGTFAILAAAIFAAAPAAAQVNVNLPWIRATAQKSAPVFMQLEAHAAGDVALVGAASPLAKSVAIVDPAPRKDGSGMRALKRLDIPAGTSVALKPGTVQLALIGVAHPLKLGSHVPLTLIFELPGGAPLSVDISAEVVKANAKTAADHDLEHQHSHSH